MARFICRNYGPSRQIDFKGQQICLSNDQCIETDDEELVAVLEETKDDKSMTPIHVTDRGPEASDTSPEELAKQKERKVTVDDPEAVHAERFPDEDDDQVESDRVQQTNTVETDDSCEIPYDEMTVAELRELAEDRVIELPKGYVKQADLIEALEDYDSCQE